MAAMAAEVACIWEIERGRSVVVAIKLKMMLVREGGSDSQKARCLVRSS
jgi:hypothetical protein